MLTDMQTEKQMDARVECGLRMEMPHGSKGIGSWIGSRIGSWEVVPGWPQVQLPPDGAQADAARSPHRPIDHQTSDKILS
jgi:hypothetical protein